MSLHRYRSATALILNSLIQKLITDPGTPIVRMVFNVASRALADLQVSDFPAVGILWLGFTPNSAPPDEGPHIKVWGTCRWAILVYDASGTDPLDFGPAADVLEDIEGVLMDFELDYAPGQETPAIMYLEDERPENIEGMTLVLAGYYAAQVTKTGG